MKAREKPSAAETIAEALRREIVDELADGSLIGSAVDLVQRFQVSAPTVRQACARWRPRGLARVRRGNNGGFFASTPSVHVVTRSAAALLRRQGADLGDLMAASQLIGPETAYTQDQRAEMIFDKTSRLELALDEPCRQAREAFSTAWRKLPIPRLSVQ